MNNHDSMIAAGNFGKPAVLTKDVLEQLNSGGNGESQFIQRLSECDDYVSTSRACDSVALGEMDI